MDIESRFNARFSIKRREEDAQYVYFEFLFSWRRLWRLRRGRIRKREIEDICELLTAGTGITEEAHLRDIGYRIRGFFPRAIRDGLRRFDEAAKELLSYSDSRMTLTIEVDRLNVPWEFSLTEDGNTHWFRRYLVARQIEPYLREWEQEEERPKELLVLMETIDIEQIEPRMDPERHLEWKSRNQSLKELIERINDEEGGIVHIELRTHGTSIGELISELQGERGPFDAIIYIGPYLRNGEEGLAIEDRFSRRVRPIHYECIKPSEHSRPLVFFDACQTGTNRSSLGEQEPALPIPDLVDYFLKNEASAFVGTIQNVEAITATVFAHHFLQSLCQDGTSVAQAMLDARNRVQEEFKEDEIGEYRRVQSGSYTLIGSSHVDLYDSFLHKGKKVKLIWPSALDCYCSGFGIELYPSGIDTMEAVRCDDFGDLKQRFEQVRSEMALDENLIPILDMPIAYAGDVISNAQRGEEWVIISSVFRPRPDREEAALYYVDPLEEIKDIYLEDYTAQVSVMSYVYLKAKCQAALEGCACTKVDYENILDRMTRDIEKSRFRPVAFILVGEHKLAFEDFLSRQGEKLDGRLQSIALHSEFRKVLEDGGWKQYEIGYQLPASVLVARRSHAMRYRKLIVEVLSRWYEWIRRCFATRHEQLFQYQEPLFRLEEDCIEAIIKFSQLICEKEGLDCRVFDEELQIKRPLDMGDFIVITPRQLGVGGPPPPDLTIMEESLGQLANALSTVDERISDLRREAAEAKGKQRLRKLTEADQKDKQLRPLREQYKKLKRQFDSQPPIDTSEFLQQCRQCAEQAERLKDP